MQKYPSTREFVSLIDALKEVIGYNLLTKNERETIDFELQAIGIDDDKLKSYIKAKHPKKRETIIRKAQEIIEEKNRKEKQEKKWNVPKVLSINNYQENTEAFYEMQPFFYDKNQIFWFWNKQDCKWEIVDETDIMNLFDNILGFEGQTISHGLKGNYLEAFKRVGRKHLPEAAPIRWIQFKDRAFSLRGGKIHRVTPDFFFTNPIPHEIADCGECPTIDKLFVEWVGVESKQSLYEIIAYCCYPSYPIQTLFCFMGGGRNGKTQFLKLIHNFLGSQNITSTELDRLFGISSSRFESFKLYKKLACIMGETNFGMLNQSSMLKKLTGGDMIGYEMKNKQPFDDYNYAKMIIASNSLPSSADTSEGFYRRWMIINFPNEFKEGKDIVDIIPSEEYAVLARKVIETLPGLLERGCFTNQGSIVERKNNYIMASNPLPSFINDYCDYAYDLYVRYSELYTAYVTYLSHMKKRIVSKKEFGDMLEQEGIEVRKTSKDINGNWVYDRYIEGLGLNEKFRNFRDNRASFPTSNIPSRELSRKSSTKVSKVSKEEYVLDTDILKFDIKCLAHIPCGYPIGDDICGNMPCNEYNGLYYCEKHFEMAQDNKHSKG